MLPRLVYTLPVLNGFIGNGPPQQHLIDLGGGTGETSLALLVHHKVQQLTFIDVAETNLEKARGLLAFAGKPIQCIQHDLSLPINLALSADSGIMTYVLSELSAEAVGTAFRNAARLLTTGGRLFVEDLDPGIFDLIQAKPDPVRPLVVTADSGHPVIHRLPPHAAYVWIIYSKDGEPIVGLPYTPHSDSFMVKAARSAGFRFETLTSHPVHPRHAESNPALLPYLDGLRFVRQFVFVRQ